MLVILNTKMMVLYTHNPRGRFVTNLHKHCWLICNWSSKCNYLNQLNQHFKAWINQLIIENVSQESHKHWWFVAARFSIVRMIFNLLMRRFFSMMMVSNSWFNQMIGHVSFKLSSEWGKNLTKKLLISSGLQNTRYRKRRLGVLGFVCDPDVFNCK